MFLNASKLTIIHYTQYMIKYIFESKIPHYLSICYIFDNEYATELS